MGKTALTVDDALFMRTMLRKILEGSGFEVLEAENGAVGVAKYQDASPDVVFMDITMPEMDGIAATKEIMAHAPNAYVVICTAVGQQQQVMDAIQAGAKDYIMKPFEPDKVLQAAAKATGS